VGPHTLDSRMLEQPLFYAALTASITAPLAVAFTLVYRTGGLFHIALGAVFSFAAYGALLALPLGILPAAFCGLAGALMLGVTTEAACYRPLRRRGATPGALLVASLGIYVMAEAALGMTFGHGLSSLRPMTSGAPVEFFGIRATQPQLTAILVGSAVTLAALTVLARSSFGNQVEAIADNRDLARAIGIPVEGVQMKATLLASLLGGVAGILTAADVDFGPTSGFRPLMAAVVASVVGGGTPAGAAIAAVVLGVLLHLSVLVLPASYQDAILFGALALALLVRPSGLLIAPPSRRGDK
jgi:branched-subunit amino acid ABC-type transport system permease component